jgi:LPXTG-site transpeptidase (sortase) family protein
MSWRRPLRRSNKSVVHNRRAGRRIESFGSIAASPPMRGIPCGHPAGARYRGGQRNRATILVLPPSEPVHIDIPKIKASAPFVPLALSGTGQLETPRDPETVGWYTKSPSPGTLGPSIIAGHATWNDRPSAFFHLHSLRPGDDIRIQRADGTTAVFVVTKLATYAKNEFPTADVYGDVDRAELRLITCTGPYLDVTQRYTANLVVYARLQTL